MNRLDLCISRDDYSVQYGCSAQATQTTGGFNRYYKKTNSKQHIVSCSAVLDEEDYWYFRAFYLDWQNNPQEFICSLVLEGFDYYSNLKQDYLCTFIPDSVMFDLNALHFNVMFQLSVFINPLFALTSRPYPVESYEHLSMDFIVGDAESRDLLTFLTDDNYLTTDFAVHDAIVYDGSAVFSAPVESLTTDFSVVSAVLSQDGPLLYLTNERVSLSFSMQDMRRSEDLIVHIATPENLGMSFMIGDAQYGDS